MTKKLKLNNLFTVKYLQRKKNDKLQVPATVPVTEVTTTMNADIENADKENAGKAKKGLCVRVDTENLMFHKSYNSPFCSSGEIDREINEVIKGTEDDEADNAYVASAKLGKLQEKKRCIILGSDPFSKLRACFAYVKTMTSKEAIKWFYINILKEKAKDTNDTDFVAFLVNMKKNDCLKCVRTISYWLENDFQGKEIEERFGTFGDRDIFLIDKVVGFADETDWILNEKEEEEKKNANAEETPQKQKKTKKKITFSGFKNRLHRIVFYVNGKNKNETGKSLWLDRLGNFDEKKLKKKQSKFTRKQRKENNDALAEEFDKMIFYTFLKRLMKRVNIKKYSKEEGKEGKGRLVYALNNGYQRRFLTEYLQSYLLRKEYLKVAFEFPICAIKYVLTSSQEKEKCKRMLQFYRRTKKLGYPEIILMHPDFTKNTSERKVGVQKRTWEQVVKHYKNRLSESVYEGLEKRVKYYIEMTEQFQKQSNTLCTIDPKKFPDVQHWTKSLFAEEEKVFNENDQVRLIYEKKTREAKIKKANEDGSYDVLFWNPLTRDFSVNSTVQINENNLKKIVRSDESKMFVQVTGTDFMLRSFYEKEHKFACKLLDIGAQFYDSTIPVPSDVVGKDGTTVSLKICYKYPCHAWKKFLEKELDLESTEDAKYVCILYANRYSISELMEEVNNILYNKVYELTGKKILFHIDESFTSVCAKDNIQHWSRDIDDSVKSSRIFQSIDQPKTVDSKVETEDFEITDDNHNWVDNILREGDAYILVSDKMELDRIIKQQPFEKGDRVRFKYLNNPSWREGKFIKDNKKDEYEIKVKDLDREVWKKQLMETIYRSNSVFSKFFKNFKIGKNSLTRTWGRYRQILALNTQELDAKITVTNVTVTTPQFQSIFPPRPKIYLVGKWSPKQLEEAYKLCTQKVYRLIDKRSNLRNDRVSFTSNGKKKDGLFLKKNKIKTDEDGKTVYYKKGIKDICRKNDLSYKTRSDGEITDKGRNGVDAILKLLKKNKGNKEVLVSTKTKEVQSCKTKLWPTANDLMRRCSSIAQRKFKVVNLTVVEPDGNAANLEEILLNDDDEYKNKFIKQKIKYYYSLKKELKKNGKELADALNKKDKTNKWEWKNNKIQEKEKKRAAEETEPPSKKRRVDNNITIGDV